MLREQRMMQRMIDEIGDELNEYIKTFYTVDLWRIKEGEVLINKTFKRVVEIIADFNLTTSDIIFKSAYKLVDNQEAMLYILDNLAIQYINEGGKGLLNRAMVFCYSLFIVSSQNNIKATDVLSNAINSNLVNYKTTLWQTVKYKLGLDPLPVKIKGEKIPLMLITVLRGEPIYATMAEIVKSI